MYDLFLVGGGTIYGMHTPWYVKAKSLMRIKGIKYASLADRLGMTESGIGHYLNGRRQPTVDQVRKIASVIGVAMAELIDEDAYFIIDEKEKEAVDLFRQVPEKDREAVIRMLAGLILPKEKDKN